jgi:hypothetical protein
MTQLIKYEAACHALAEAHAVDEVKDIRDKSIAMQCYGRQAKNKQIEIYGAEIRIRAERKLGEMIKNGQNSGAIETHGGNRKSTSPLPSLNDMGISYDLSSHAQSLASIPEDEFEATLAEHREEQQAVTGRTMEKLAGRAHVTNNSGNNEWYTPSEYVEAARKVMGGIDCDPASSEIANQTVNAKIFFTSKQDGLKQKWTGRVWMNPPYAQPLIHEFCTAARDKYLSGEIKEACVLVNNATDTAWFQILAHVCRSICFVKSRIRFLDLNGNPSGAPLQGQAIIYIGEKPKEFNKEFSSKGIVLYK